MRIDFISLKGRRETNEDKHTIKLNLDGKNKEENPINIYGIYDGHGIENGRIISSYLSKTLPVYLINKETKYPLKEAYIKKLYLLIQDTIKTKLKKYIEKNGSTCLIVCQYIHNNINYLDILNTGDSRCVMCVEKKVKYSNLTSLNSPTFEAVALTQDHKPNWTKELERITKLGGKIEFDGVDWRIGDLSVSRSFGDTEFEKYITCMPDLIRHRIDKTDKFLVIACDGLWDVMSNQDVVNFIISYCYDILTWKKINTKNNIAKLLAEYALKLGSTDNISIIIVFFDDASK